MRPRRLELEGFSAYRAPTVIDFDGVDLFALSGATGSGKTAVLDAIAFALYGVVHRLGNKAAVAPAISQGMHEARVRLDFSVGDQDWTALRVVRRTKGGGASTAEARLEGPDGVTAGSADEVTARVTELLGLTYDHFSRCVVLPQGEFARFLHDRAADRLELLVSLLELDLYGRIAERARARAAAARSDTDRLTGALERVGDATPEAVAGAERRAADLRTLLGALDADVPAVAALAVEEDAARAAADALTAEADRLAAVEVPGDVAGLAEAHQDACAELERAVAVVEAAEREEEAAQVVVSGGPDRAELVALRQAFDERAQLTDRLDKGRAIVADRQADLAAAEQRLAAAASALEAARLAAEKASLAHQAHAVRAQVAVGEPCPVCAQVVSALPDEAPPADLDASRKAAQRAERSREEALAGRASAADELTRADTLLGSLSDQVGALDDRLAGRDQAHLDGELAAVTAAAEALTAATASTRAARQAEKAARQRVAAAAANVATAKERFDAVRDTVVGLGAPPRVGGDDLAAEWSALAGWAAAEVPGRREEVASAGARVGELAARRAALLHSLAARCVEAGVDVHVAGGETPRDAAAGALARAEAASDQVRRQLDDAVALEARRVAAVSRHDVARSLATHLDARHFEKWLLDEAVRALAEGATEMLHTLSGGHYSLAVDGKGGFVVIDHHNADESRPARTLSGGETFLASLALALALADRIASLAAGGSARLDAIFLDEGFGTLDPDTLDVVATAIEELGAAGRMVGVVSHVAELAERVPVRFEVSRTGNSSTIERVDR